MCRLVHTQLRVERKRNPVSDGVSLERAVIPAVLVKEPDRLFGHILLPRIEMQVACGLRGEPELGRQCAWHVPFMGVERAYLGIFIPVPFLRLAVLEIEHRFFERTGIRNIEVLVPRDHGNRCRHR